MSSSWQNSARSEPIKSSFLDLAEDGCVGSLCPYVSPVSLLSPVNVAGKRSAGRKLGEHVLDEAGAPGDVLQDVSVQDVYACVDEF